MAGSDVWGGLRCVALEHAQAVIAGVPFDGGVGGRAGAAHAPRYLRHLSPRLKTLSWRGHDFSEIRLHDVGDILVPRLQLPESQGILRERYRELWRAGATPITVGGDHSITFPIVESGVRTGGRWGIIWIDAHPDLLDRYLDSPISHGCPLRRIVVDAGVDPRDVLVIGTRAYDLEEREFMDAQELEEVPAVDFHLEPASALARVANVARSISQRVDHLYVSIDVDVLDPAFAPGTGTPVAGGLTTGQLLLILNSLPPAVRGYDIVEYAPPLDVGEMTGNALLSVLGEILSRVAFRNAR